MSVPEKMVKANLIKAKGTTIYGVKVEDMSRDELIACVIYGFEATQTAVETHQGDLRVLAGGVIWGSIEMKENRDLSFTMTWHHNPLLKMTRQEQLDNNMKSDPDFCVTKQIEPAVRMVWR